MSTAVLCNNLVPGVCCSRFRFSVDVGEHYWQDTAADRSVRSVEPVTLKFEGYEDVRPLTIQLQSVKGADVLQPSDHLVGSLDREGWSEN